MTAREGISDRALSMAAKVETFVRETVIPYETDSRRDHHGAPTDELVMEMREHARAEQDANAHAEATLDTVGLGGASHQAGPEGTDGRKETAGVQ